MKRFILAAAIAIAGVGPAAAIDFNAPIKSIDGKPVPLDATKPNGDLLTLGKACEDALVAQLVGDQPTTSEKNKRFWIALKIHEGKKDLTADEITEVKKVIGLAYGPLVVGRAFEMLDPASVQK